MFVSTNVGLQSISKVVQEYDFHKFEYQSYVNLFLVIISTKSHISDHIILGTANTYVTNQVDVLANIQL